jgi:hypothetical protein
LSLILDALNRSRQDSDPVPGLATRHDADVVPPHAAWRQYLPWSALVAAVLVIAYLLLERGGPVPAPMATLSPVPQTQQPAPAKPEVAQPVMARAGDEAEQGPAAGVSPAPPEVEPAPAAAAPVDPAVAQLYDRPVEEAPPADGPPRSTDGKAQVAPGEKVAPAMPAAQQETRVDIEQLVRQAQEEIENARLAEHSAPFIAELSQQTKDSIPTVYYQRHDYAGDGANSRVVLNGQELARGGSPVSGMRVVEILPDSVVLDYRGTEFRLRALNSWINL